MTDIADKRLMSFDNPTPTTATLPESSTSQRKKRGPRSGAQDVYEAVRRDILNGVYRPGDILNQVHIAVQYGVSRTPVREALRMLQAEGLAEAQFKHRIRVTPITPSEIDAVYAIWILLDALAVSLTIPRMSADELDELRRALNEMNKHSPLKVGINDEWRELHIDFHRLLTMHAGPDLATARKNCQLAAERARRTSRLASDPDSWLASEAEHTAIVEAYAQGEVAKAREIICGQFSRVALTVIGNLDPSYEPVAIRQAWQLVVQQDTLGLDFVQLASFKDAGGNKSARPNARASRKAS